MIRRTIAGLVGYFLKWKILTRRTLDGDHFLFSFYLRLFNIVVDSEIFQSFGNEKESFVK